MFIKILAVKYQLTNDNRQQHSPIRRGKYHNPILGLYNYIPIGLGE